MEKKTLNTEATAPAPLLTVKDVAEWLAVSPATIYRLKDDPRAGFPRAVQVGNIIRWRREAIEAFLDAASQ